MQLNKLVFAVFSVFLLVSFASAVSINFEAPTSSNTIITDGSIDYNVVLSDALPENVLDFDVVLYTSSYGYVYGDSDWSNVLSVSGTFSNIADGNYILYSSATLSTGETLTSTVKVEVDRVYTVDNPPAVVYSDPTPENNALINSYNLNSAKIVAVADEIVDQMNIDIFNDSGIVTTIPYTNERETDYDIKDLFTGFGDGLYSYNVTATDNGLSVTSKTRTFRLKATLPTASDINITGIPVSIDEDTSFSVEGNMSVSEQPVQLRLIAYMGSKVKTISTIALTNYSGEALTFTGSIADPGTYNVSLSVSDEYGNSNRYELGNVIVSDVIEPTLEERRRGRRSSSSDDNNDQTVSKPSSRFNLTLVDTVKDKEEVKDETKEETEEKAGVLSFITGAVTGAFSTPPKAILTFIIIVVIIYALVKIRGYIVAEADKPKKNGKKSSSKKEKDEEETDSE